jgi:hypothetical protein
MTAGGPAARRETFFSASPLVAPTLLAGGSGSRALALQQRAHRQSFDARSVLRVGMGIDNHASNPSIVALEGLSTAVVALGRLEEAHYFREWMIQGQEGRDNSVCVNGWSMWWLFVMSM